MRACASAAAGRLYMMYSSRKARASAPYTPASSARSVLACAPSAWPRDTSCAARLALCGPITKPLTHPAALPGLACAPSAWPHGTSCTASHAFNLKSCGV